MKAVKAFFCFALQGKEIYSQQMNKINWVTLPCSIRARAYLCHLACILQLCCFLVTMLLHSSSSSLWLENLDLISASTALPQPSHTY